jgi:hypothetical protein
MTDPLHDELHENPTQAGDQPETGAGPPAEEQTSSLLAYGSEEPETEPEAEPGQTVSKRRVVAWAAGILAVGCAVAGGIVAWDATHHPTTRSHPAAPTTTAAAPTPGPLVRDNPTTAVAPPPMAAGPSPGASPPLDGTYRIDNDYDKMTVNSRLSPFSGKGPRQPSWSEWYGFRSVCAAAGCVATSTKLDRNNLQAADPNLQETGHKAITYVLRWAEGAWQGERTYQGVCSNGGGPQTEAEMLSLEPQPDGTYRGADTTMGYECNGTPGSTTVLPFVAWRIGAPPPGVVADPAAPPPPAPAPAAPPPPAAPTPPAPAAPAPPPAAPTPSPEPCYSPEHPECPPRGLTPEQRENW